MISTIPVDRQQEFQPIAARRRGVADILGPGPDDIDAGAAAALLPFDPSRCRPRIERSARIDNGNADAIRLAGKSEFNFILRGQTAMVIEIRDQFLDHDAESCQLVVGEPLRLTECTRSFGGLNDRIVTPQANGRLVRI